LGASTSLAARKAIVDAVQSYLTARNGAYGPSYDATGLSRTLTGRALSAARCILQQLRSSGGYYLFNTAPTDDPSVQVNTAQTRATYTQTWDGHTTQNYGDGTQSTFRDKYTVSYYLSNTPGGWKVGDYVSQSSSEVETASSDLKPCQ
jgi:hypothetical protein